ncbi:MAG TPA: hypothetical protein VFZ66_06340 [Herpetosiphonaceae bacterium]
MARKGRVPQRVAVYDEIWKHTGWWADEPTISLRVAFDHALVDGARAA